MTTLVRDMLEDSFESVVNLKDAGFDAGTFLNELLEDIELVAVVGDGCECGGHFCLCFIFYLEGSAFNTDILIHWSDFVNNF